MITEYLRVPEDGKITPSLFAHAGEILRRGGLVAFPTETVYGLGGDATNADAARKIYEAKGRPSNNPLIVHIAKPEDAEAYAFTDERYYRIARAFMPGPITVILPSRHTVAQTVSAGLDTLALRCPENAVARALIEAAGRPIAAPSANTSGRPSPTCASHVAEDLDGKIDMIIDGGNCAVGLESTIIKLEEDRSVLLRPGKVTYEQLTALLGQVEISRAVLEKPLPDEKVESPGMLLRHYAPKAPLTLVRGGRAEMRRFLSEKAGTEGGVVLCYDGFLPEKENILSLGKEENGEEAAHLLFSALRAADEMRASEIWAPYPSKDGIGLALLNRMLRAAAFRVLDLPAAPTEHH